MGSRTEASWFDPLRQAARGRIVSLITNRFATAMHADIIHVMQDGRVVESGTHQQRLALRGSYASSWMRQTREPQVPQLA